jgi:hypothetical protein
VTNLQKASGSGALMKAHSAARALSASLEGTRRRAWQALAACRLLFNISSDSPSRACEMDRSQPRETVLLGFLGFLGFMC